MAKKPKATGKLPLGGRISRPPLTPPDHPIFQERWNVSLGESLSSIAARRSDQRGSFVRLAMARQLKLQRAKRKKS